MRGPESVRQLVVLTLTAAFLVIVANSLVTWTRGRIGTAEGTKSASQIVYPSLTICPFFSSPTSNSESRNLTEYYRNRSIITNHIKLIQHEYETENG